MVGIGMVDMVVLIEQNTSVVVLTVVVPMPCTHCNYPTETCVWWQKNRKAPIERSNYVHSHQ